MLPERLTTAATSIKRRAIGRYLHQLAEPPHGVGVLLRYDETATAHWSGVRAITRRERLLAPAFFNSLPSVGSPQLAQPDGRGQVRFHRHGGKRFLLPLVEAFRINIQGACSSLGRAAFIGQA